MSEDIRPLGHVRMLRNGCLFIDYNEFWPPEIRWYWEPMGCAEEYFNAYLVNDSAAVDEAYTELKALVAQRRDGDGA